MDPGEKIRVIRQHEFLLYRHTKLAQDTVHQLARGETTPLISEKIGNFLLQDWKKFGRALANWTIVLVGLVMARGATALALVIVARQVLPIEYGQYLSSQGLIGSLVILPGYGMDVWLLTRGRSSPAEVSRLWFSTIRVRLAFLLIWVVGMIGLRALFLPVETFPPQVMLPILFGTAFDSLVLLSYAAFRSVNQHGRVAFFQVLFSLVLLGITFVLPLGPGRISLFANGKALLSGSVAVVVIITASAGWLKRVDGPIPARKILSSARPFMMADLATAIYDKADLNIISLFLGATAASVYGPALNLLHVSFLVPQALFFLTVPILSKTYLANSRHSFIRRGVMQFAAQALTGLFLFVIAFLFAPTIISLVLGSAYAQSSDVLRLLSMILLLKSLNFALAAVLVSGNLQPQRTKIQSICALFNIVANLAVVIPFGLVGVAVVYISSELLLLMGYSFLAYSQFNKKAGENAFA